MTATKLHRDLHMPAHVLRLKGLTLTAKVILAEVLDIYKVSGHVFATDEHFAARLDLGHRTVGESIKALCDAGHLLRVVNQKGLHKRVLIPSEAMLSGIVPTEDETEESTNTLKIVLADSAIGQEELPQNPQEPIADSATTYSGIRYNLLRIPLQPIAESANINTNLNTIVNTSSKKEDAALAASLPEKKIEEVEHSELPPDDSPASASHTGGARRKKADAVPAPELVMPPWATELFEQGFRVWLTYRQAPPRKKLQPASIQLTLDRLAEFDEPFCLMLFRDAITNGWQGLVFDTTGAKYEVFKASKTGVSLPGHRAAAVSQVEKRLSVVEEARALRAQNKSQP